MIKITEYVEATTMNAADYLEKSETNSPSLGFTSKKITWANFIIAIKALLTYVIGDGGASVVGNLPIYNSTDGIHITDSGIPKPGIYKRSFAGGSEIFIFTADTMIKEISVKFGTGSLTLKIGTTVGGTDILESTVVTEDINLVNLNYYCATNKNLYVTTSGTGSLRMRIDFITKFFN